MEKILKYLLIFISLIVFIGAIIYKMYALNNLGIFLNLFISISIFVIIVKLNKKVNYSNKIEISFDIQHYITTLIYLILVLGLFVILIKNSTSESIISPWTKIPAYYFILYLLATLTLIINIIKNNKFNTFLISIHYFLSFSIATIIYKIGYGFDPYIHEAAINHIIDYGYIAPKTFYYSGYYSLIITIHKIFFIPVFILNKFVVPVMASLLIPITLITVLKKWFSNNNKILLLSLLMLFLPFNIFILSTPQNLAYLFLILTLLFSLVQNNHFDLILIYLLALSSFAIQPIAGIPAIILSLYLTIYNLKYKKIKKYFYILLFLFSTLILPALFFILNKNELSINGDLLKNIFSISFFDIVLPHKETIFLNSAYLINFNYKYIIASLVLTGIIITWKDKERYKLSFIYLLMFLSSMISYVFIIIQPFSFLISYERSDYANRIIIIALIFTLPFIAIALYHVISAILRQNNTSKTIISILLLLILVANIYASYPRIDNYHNSHGLSTSGSDLDAVKWIESDAKDNYIVLANQQVSAASLHEFEFNKYYKINDEDIFYYSIPTGGALYQYYLKMINEKPGKENAQSAMDFMGVNNCYFVLNKYWWSFPKILEEAKNEADSFKNIDNEVYIFKYTK